MSKGDSFDPRTWAAGQPAPTEPGAAALPDMWRAVAQPGAPAPTPPSARAPSTVTDDPAGRRGSRLVTFAVSAALLLTGAGAAWLTRGAPPPQGSAAAALATPEAPPPPNVVSRAMTLRLPSEIKAALIASKVTPDEARVAAAAAEQALTRPEEIHVVLQLLPTGDSFTVNGIHASYADGSGAVVTRDEAGAFSARAIAAELTKQIKVLRGEIDSESFYTSAVSAGVIDTLIPEFINAFSFDFNLAAEVSPGDTFEVAYEQAQSADGRAVGQPQLLFASLTTAEKSKAIYRFAPPGQEPGWFDGNGASNVRSFMRTPVDGARITSNFGMRFHPVLHYNRLHAGVDFGVPIGTPVYASAAGVVIGSHPTGCGGNMAVVQHDNGWVTRYFHLSKFADGLHEGQRVEQGFTLGLSGTTGTCTTGPHLHYELRIDGEPVDPMSVPMNDAQKKRLEGAALKAFIEQRDRVDVARAQQAS